MNLIYKDAVKHYNYMSLCTKHDHTASLIVDNPSLTLLSTYLAANLSIFTALHVMQTRYSDENSVRLSVCHTRAL